MSKKPSGPIPAPEAIRQELSVLSNSYFLALSSLRELFKNALIMQNRLRDLGNPVPESIAAYARIYTMHEKMKEVLTHVGSMKDDFSKNILPSAMENTDIDTLTISEGHRVTRTEKIYASIKSDNKEKAYEWLREAGAGDIISETVNASTLSSYAKSLLEENKELPEELFSVLTVPSVSLTRAKGWKMEE